MAAAEEYKGHASPLIPLLAQFDALIAADDYKGVAEAYAAFVKAHETSRFLALEPIPFKISAHLARKHGSSSAVTTFTLRRSTWASEVKAAIEKGPDAFVALAGEIDAAVAELASKAKKLS